FLARVGRGKFIYRLYESLEETGRGDLAKAVYAKARAGYHPIAQRRIDEILKAE
ncbi:MAG: leukotriene A4 hydrolase C-terminal domain-containing protein, partial [Parvularculaceae bacterium]